MGEKGAAKRLHLGRRHCRGLAESGENDAREGKIGRRDDGQQLVFLAGKAARCDRALEGAAGAPIELGGCRGELALLLHADDDGAGLRQGGLTKRNLHAILSKRVAGRDGRARGEGAA